jgi:hypothetical protein
VPLAFAGQLDHTEVVEACAALTGLVGSVEVAAAWGSESALPGMTVGGLTRHLVSQPECAVEFLAAPAPAAVETVTITEYYDRVDWLLPPRDAEENTSIRDDFNAMAAGGLEESRAILRASVAALPAAIRATGPTTYVPWQNCALALDDFLVCRLLELVVHADDLAVSVGRPTPTFADEVRDPVLALLAALSVRRHGQDAVLRSLARSERAGGSVSAFEG